MILKRGGKGLEMKEGGLGVETEIWVLAALSSVFFFIILIPHWQFHRPPVTRPHPISFEWGLFPRRVLAQLKLPIQSQVLLAHHTATLWALPGREFSSLLSVIVPLLTYVSFRNVSANVHGLSFVTPLTWTFIFDGCIERFESNNDLWLGETNPRSYDWRPLVRVPSQRAGDGLQSSASNSKQLLRTTIAQRCLTPAIFPPLVCYPVQ